MNAFTNENLIENPDLQRVTNHPVHILTEDGNLSPTALIPFCSFSTDFSVMGVEIDNFDVPVCNSFKAKIFKDQLCYQVDLNQFKSKIDLFEKVSFSLFIDYNEDRQLFLHENEDEDVMEPQSSFVIIETLGEKPFLNSYLINFAFFQIHWDFPLNKNTTLT